MFYVYQYINPITSLPFYIGKGSGDRKYSHLNETLETTENKRKYYKIQSLKKLGIDPIIEEIKSFENEEDAYRFETLLIQTYGRKGYDTNGILTNICIDSNPPIRKGAKLTVEQKEKLKQRYTLEVRQKISETLKGRTPWNKGVTGAYSQSKESNEKRSKSLKGKKVSEETKEKIRQHNLGKKKSEETKDKMSKNMKGRIPHNKGKKYGPSAKAIMCVFISPTGQEFEYVSFRQGCLDHNLPTDKISEVKTGKRTDYKGWTVKIK